MWVSLVCNTELVNASVQHCYSLPAWTCVCLGASEPVFPTETEIFVFSWEQNCQDCVEVGSLSMQCHVQLWNTFQRCPWQIKVKNSRNLIRDLSRDSGFMADCICSPPFLDLPFHVPQATNYWSFFPLEDKHLITSPLFYHPYHSAGSAFAHRWSNSHISN